MVRARAHVVGAILQTGAVFEEPALKEAGFLLAAGDRTGELHSSIHRFVPRMDDPVDLKVRGGLLRLGDLRLLTLVHFAFHQIKAVRHDQASQFEGIIILFLRCIRFRRDDGTRLEDSPYYMGPGANHVGNLDRDVTFYGHWRTAESGEGSPDGGDGFGTLLAVGAVVGAAGVVAYQVGTELILDQLLPAGVAVPHTRAELAMLLWNTAGRPAPATLPAFADVADPELAQAAQWAIEQGYLKARADGSFKPDKGVAKWRVIRGYRAVTEP